jgi:release factor glutamine methyltransferase
MKPAALNKPCIDSPARGAAATIRSLVESGRELLRSSHIRTYYLDAEVLGAFALRTSRVRVMTRGELLVSKTAQAFFNQLVFQRARGMPVAYLTHEKEFMGIPFYVDERVLIPRPETELMVEEIMRIAQVSPPLRILDVGTGSGAIALSCARYVPNAVVIGSDRSAAALEVAAENIRRQNLAHRVALRTSDLFSAFKHGSDIFDIIVSNPPYIDRDEMSALPGDVLYEPWQALDGGDGGMELLRAIIEQAPRYIAPNGYLILEMDPRQKEQVIEACNNRHARRVTVVRDYAGFDRIAVAQF